jgi:hypothetical protein
MKQRRQRKRSSERGDDGLFWRPGALAPSKKSRSISPADEDEEATAKAGASFISAKAMRG